MSFFSSFEIGTNTYNVKDALAGKSLSVNGQNLSLLKADGSVVSTVTLPFGGARYTETELFNGTATMGTAVEFSEAWSNYDLLIIEMAFSSSYDHVRTMILNTTDIEYGSNPNIYANGFYWSSDFYALARFSFPTTSSIRADTYSTTSSEVYTIKRVIGIKWELQETALIYSEEEREIGVWIDGKPLYQKSFKFQGSYTGDTNNLSVSLPDAEMAFLKDCWARNQDNAYLPLPYSHSNADNVATVFIYSTLDRVGVRCAESVTLTELNLNICYTKTTDVAGSGTYVTTGGYAHHYSTTEHVVGTWVNGKPLYEVTIVGRITHNGETYVSYASDNAEIVFIHEQAYITDTGYTWTDGYCTGSLFKGGFANTDSDGARINVSCYIGSSSSSAIAPPGTLYSTVRYTKTTD